jgi:hypothetical protein
MDSSINNTLECVKVPSSEEETRQRTSCKALFPNEYRWVAQSHDVYLCTLNFQSNRTALAELSKPFVVFICSLCFLFPSFKRGAC